MRNMIVTLSVGVMLYTTAAIAESEPGKAREASKPLPNCPVMGEPINLAVSAPTDDGPAYFCCQGCVRKFKKDPARYASAIGEQRKALASRPAVQTLCPVSQKPVDQKVSIDENGKKTYFCCQGCVSKYQKNPAQYAAALANSYTYQTICPVMGKTIDPTSFTTLADGRNIYYCCDGCEGKLFGNPVKYAKSLADQGFQYNWAKIKKADDKEAKPHAHHGGHGHDGHDHDGHDH